MRKSHDIYTLSMFEPEQRPGYKTREDGMLEDPAGNIYDEKMNLIKEAPSEALLLARKRHPGLSDSELRHYVLIYRRELEKKKNNPES
ncbi:MAG: hypothetical protein AAB871_00555 [Patescibacteria group bacterium]